MKNYTQKSFLRNYYLFSFFYDFVFAYAIYNVLFSMKGLSVFQISLLLSWWALVAVILEIPTGGLADSWNRKKMLVLAPIFKSFCFIIWFFARGNFYLYGLGFVFWALGSSFVSGTSEALLYDTLKHADKTEGYEKILGKRKFYFNIALAIATITGGFIANYNINFAVILSVVPLLLSAFFASLIQEVPKIEITGEIHYFEYIKTAFREIKASRVLLYIFIYLLAISIFADLEEFDQLYYQLAKLPLYAFGIFGFIWSSLNALGSYYAHRFKGNSIAFYLFPVASALCLVLVSKYPSIPMIGVLLLSYFLTTPLRIIMESNLQHNIQSISRATITSVSTLLSTLFGVLLTLGFGLISKIWNLQAIYLSTAIFLVVFSLWVFVVRNDISVKKANSHT